MNSPNQIYPNGAETNIGAIATLTAQEEAREAINQGWSPIPVPHGGKGSVIPGWQNLRVTADTYDEHFNGTPQNVAILNGEPSGGLVDVDLDCALAVQIAPAFLPETGRIFGRTSKLMSHWLYIADPLPKTTKHQDTASGVIIELRSTGSATMWPGSQHPLGELVTWGKKGAPARVDGLDLQKAVATLAAAVLIVQLYPRRGGRDDLKLALVGALVSCGWDDDQIRQFILTVARAAGDEEAEERVGGIERTRQRIENGEPVASWKQLGEHLHDKPAARKIRQLLQPITDDQRARHMPQKKEDFVSLLSENKAIFMPTRSVWPLQSVRATVLPVLVGYDADGEEIYQASDVWLATHHPVHQMTWAPSEPPIIEGRVLDDGGWIERPDLRAFNQYRAPTIVLGDPEQAEPWTEHIRGLYPDHADHLIGWFAHRVQRPQEKINHALVLGGAPGIGKDTILAAVQQAVGPWNYADVSPTAVMGRFNPFVKNVIVQISEARDLGEINRYGFYEHMKSLTASPPDTILCDEKYVNAYPVLNVCGIVYTTNNRTDALYLPENDRRHYIAWSDRTQDEFESEFFEEFWRWYGDGGFGHVAAFLSAYDLSDFNPKAPPPKTPAFWAIVNANRAPEDAELTDVLDDLGNPDAVTISQIIQHLEKPRTPLGKGLSGEVTDLSRWLGERRNARQIPHRMESVGYVAVDNPGSKDGVWKVRGVRKVIYARKDLSLTDQIAAANQLIATASPGSGS